MKRVNQITIFIIVAVAVLVVGSWIFINSTSEENDANSENNTIVQEEQEGDNENRESGEQDSDYDENDKEVTEKNPDSANENADNSDELSIYGNMQTLDKYKLVLKDGEIFLESDELEEDLKVLKANKKIEMFMPNDSGNYLIYGCYKSDIKNVRGEKIGEYYDWYAYDIKMQQKEILSGIDFPLENGSKETSDKVWGWYDENSVVIGIDGVMAMGTAALHNLETKKQTPMAYEDFEQWLKESKDYAVEYSFGS